MKLRGNYSGSVTYDVGDIVLHTDGVFYHKFMPCKSGVPPVDTLYWNRLDQNLAQAAQMAMDIVAETGGITASDVANNLTTTAKGKVLDARQGKALKELIDALTERVAALEPSDEPAEEGT